GASQPSSPSRPRAPTSCSAAVAAGSDRRVWRNNGCVAGARCSPPGSVLSRAHIYGYGRSLRPPQGTSIARRRRAPFRQTLLSSEDGLAARADVHDQASFELERLGLFLRQLREKMLAVFAHELDAH